MHGARKPPGPISSMKAEAITLLYVLILTLIGEELKLVGTVGTVLQGELFNES